MVVVEAGRWNVEETPRIDPAVIACRAVETNYADEPASGARFLKDIAEGGPTSLFIIGSKVIDDHSDEAGKMPADSHIRDLFCRVNP